jgi:hypothetical protein
MIHQRQIRPGEWRTDGGAPGLQAIEDCMVSGGQRVGVEGQGGRGVYS